jgi:hypothetical protein
MPIVQGAKCLETRTTPDGLVRRRYQAPSGVTFWTVEAPAPVWKGCVSKPRADARLSKWRQGLEVTSRRAEGKRLLAEGWKPAAVANHLGVTERAVTRWRKGAACASR